MAYRDFTNDYKADNPGGAYVFYGAEDFLIEWATDRIIRDNIEDEYRELDVRIIDGETADAVDILSEAKAYSMFSARRIVVVRNYLPMYKKAVDAAADDLTDYSAEIAADPGSSPSILIFTLDSANSQSITSFGKQLIKKCNSYEFTKLERGELSAFITKRIRAAGKTISGRELNHIMDVTGYFNRDSAYSLQRMDQDIVKLIGASEGDVIDMELVDDIMMGEDDKFVFNLVDLLVSGDKGGAFEIAETIIREDDGAMGILSLLARQFEIMYDALELSDKGMSMSAMATATGVNEYRFKKAYKAAVKYDKDKLKSLIIDLYNIDRDIKNGNMDKDTALELFIIGAAA